MKKQKYIIFSQKILITKLRLPIGAKNRAVSGYKFKWAKLAALPKIEKIYKEDLAGQGNQQVI